MLRMSPIGPLVLAFANLLTLSACGESYQGGSATQPEARDADFWTTLHQKFLDRAKQGDVDLLFLGDSITQGWNDNEVWQRYYAPRKAANFGIGGDRTQHVLWRLDHGEIDGIAPKVAVLMIGTNNIGSNTPAEIAEGVRAIVDRLRSRLPRTKVLILGVFPRGAHRDRKDVQADQIDPRTAQVNELIRKLDDGSNVRYLDLTPAFLDADGLLPRSLMPDLLHLSPAGYRKWAEAMEPTLWEMMQGE